MKSGTTVSYDLRGDFLQAPKKSASPGSHLGSSCEAAWKYNEGTTLIITGTVDTGNNPQIHKSSISKSEVKSILPSVRSQSY